MHSIFPSLCPGGIDAMYYMGGSVGVFAHAGEKIKDAGKKIIGKIKREFNINDPRDLFSITGTAISHYFVGISVSFDRVVLDDGTIDWFWTAGLAIGAPGGALAVDIGTIEIDTELTKNDFLGYSAGIDVTAAAPLGWGLEVAGNPFNRNRRVEDYSGPQNPSNWGYVKHGPRLGFPSITFLPLNWTSDLGD